MTVAEIVTRRAPIAANSWNPDTRTFDVVFSAGGAVRRYDHRGEFVEMLAVAGFRDAVGVTFLDGHRSGSIDDILGTVVAARVENGQAIATIRVSAHSERAKRMTSDMADGVKFPISVGYVVNSFSEVTDPKTKVRTKTATNWVVHEISVVAVPADRVASTRNRDVLMPSENTMTNEVPEVNAAPLVPDDAATRASANQEIRSLARDLGLPATWSDNIIDTGASVAQAGAAALEAVRQRGAAGAVTSRATVGQDFSDPESQARYRGEALYARMSGQTPSEPARQFASLSVLDHSREILRMRGMSANGPAHRIIERALGTSDLPLLMEDAANRILVEKYRTVQSALKPLAKRKNARDFRGMAAYSLAGPARLEKVGEHGEYQYTALVENKESMAIDSYGGIIPVTRKLLIDDNIGALASLSELQAEAAANTEAKLFIDLFAANSGLGPMLSDNKSLFHADHGNKAPTGGALSETTLSAACVAMRKQTGMNGEIISVTPRFLIVPAELEWPARKLLAQTTPSSTNDVSLFARMFELIVESRLTSPTKWYLAASPNEVNALWFSYLEGNEGPFVESRVGWNIDGIEVKCRLEVGVGAVGYRGLYMNPGA